MTDETEEMVEAQGGVLLAHTALFAAVLEVMRSKGLLSQTEISIVFDSALVGVENAPVITEATTKQARLTLEKLASEMSGPPRPDPTR